MANEEYVVSDENGNYVSYTSSFSEAQEIADDGKKYLAECDKEGTYAVGIRTEAGYSFDCIL